MKRLEMKRLEMNMLRAVVCAISLCVAIALPVHAAEGEHRPAELGMLLTLSRSSADPSRAWLVVRGIGPGTPAERAGIHAGDLIIEIGGQAIAFKNELDLMLGLSRLEPGKPLHLTVVRDRKRQDVELVPRRMGDPGYEQWKASLAALQTRMKAGGSTP
jgi:S1-C subfamily serine protease